MLTLLLCAGCAHAQTKIGYVVKGKLMVQNASGGKTRAATEAEKTKWRKVSNRINPISPDGKYSAQAVSADPDSDFKKAFRIVDAKSGREVVSVQTVMALLGGGIYDDIVFDGWLPDSRHFAAFAHQHISSNEFYNRGVINLNSKTRLAFNGWLSRDGKTAIVPDKEGLMEDSTDHYHQTATEYVRTYGERKWFVGSPPSWKKYKFKSLRKRPLMLQKMPFAFTGKVLGVYHRFTNDQNRIERPSSVVFSSDDKWALLRGYHDYPIDYLVSLSTGQMKKLPGVQAKFLS